MVKLVANFIFLTILTLLLACFSSQLNIFFSKDKNNLLHHLLLKFSTPPKVPGLPKPGYLLWWKTVRVAEKQKRKKKEQADINISISYLDLLMFLDTNELTYNWKFLLTHRLEYFVSKGNIIYLRKSIYVSTPMISCANTQLVKGFHLWLRIITEKFPRNRNS